MESKKINQLATELAPELSDLTIIGDPTTGISKKITLSQMASLFTGTVEEYANLASFPLVGAADTIYIALDTNIIYRWNTSTNAYVELSPNIVTSLVFNDANGFDGTINLVGSTATLTITTALTTGSVGFIGTSGALLEDNANFFWNNSTKRLGINTNAPTTAIDVFGSGIIGRLNGTSTNNAFLGFASAGSNKWSIGNVQSDHRFRIYNEVTTSELVSVLQTGEFGIGIANPLTKLHIFGGASALIANLDANTSVAKSISFRSGNSSRINLEVSGTESGSNAGMDLFVRTYTDAGALIETPLSIVRSTGVTTIKSLTLTNALSVANGGTGTTTFTAGRILFGNGTSAINTSANLFWDNTNSRLGLGTALPNNLLELSSATSGGSLRFSSSSNTAFYWDIGRDSVSTGDFLFRKASGGVASDIMRITNDGSVGIGVTPSAWGSSIKALQVAAYGSFSTSGGVDTQISNNAYYDGTNWRYIASQEAANYYMNRDTHVWRYKSAGTTGGTITWNEAMRINASGNVGIGTSSPSSISSFNKILHIDGGSNNSAICLSGDSLAGQANIGYAGSVLYIDAIGAATGANNAITFNTTNVNSSTTRVERMRITSGGNVLMGKTSTGAILNNGFEYNPSSNYIATCSSVAADTATYISNTASSGTRFLVRFYGTSAEVGRIQHDGTNTSYVTSSDYRLKEDLKEVNGLDKVSAIKIYDFKWKNSNNRMDGVIAHELAEVLPYAVSGDKDEIEKDGTIKVQGVDYSKLVPVLVKAIQEQQIQIEELKNK